MFLKKIIRLPRTLSARLTLWYAGIFCASCLISYFLFSLMVTSVIQDRSDEELVEQVEEFQLLLASEGIEALKREILLEGEEEKPDEMFFRLLTAEGEELVSTDMSSWKNVTAKKAALEQLAEGESHFFETVTISENRGRARIVYGALGLDAVVQIGMSLEDDDESLHLFQLLFLLALGVLVLFVPCTGWFIAKHALKGVEEVTTTALNISKGDFEQRVPPKARGEEIERLAKAFNYMLDRINALITGIRNMTDNIAHDLRSPITRMRGTAEAALLSESDVQDCKNTLAGTIEECDRLLELINTMLDISEAEVGADILNKRQIDVADVVQRAYELFQPIAEAKRVTMTAHISPPCQVAGDLQKIQRMVANLLDNALKYTPPKGTVTVSVARDNGQIVSSFSDTGIGISETDLPHIFKRFYRCDQSRSQAGVGLGLSLAQAIAKSHGGDIMVSSQLGIGSTFTVMLPQSAGSA